MLNLFSHRKVNNQPEASTLEILVCFSFRCEEQLLGSHIPLLHELALQISVGATGEANGTVVAHVIPTLNFGVSALSNIVSANVFLEVDTSATMILNIDGTGNTVGTVTPRAELAGTQIGRGLLPSPPTSLNRREPQANGAALTTNSASFGGCFEMDGGVDISVGADASFFGLFNADTKLSLFNKEFEILRVNRLVFFFFG